MKKLALILIVIFVGCNNPDKDAYTAQSYKDWCAKIK